MLKLLRADLFRLGKNRLFKWAFAMTALVTAAFVVISCISIKGDRSEYALENYALAGAPLVQIVSAAVIVLFVGTEHSQHTIRNKLTVGSRRGNIYSSELAAGVVIGCSLNAAWLLGGLAGVPFLGAWKMPLSETMIYIAVSMLCAAAVSAVAALIGALFQNRSRGVITALITVFVMIQLAGHTYTRLSAPEQQMRAEVINGEQVMSLEKNPQYVNGAKRAAYELAMRLNPLGSLLPLSNRDLKVPAADMAGAGVVIILVSSTGNAVFKRKDLK